MTRHEKSREDLNAKLLQSAALSRGIIDGMTEGVIAMDERHIVLDMNPSALQMFAFPKSEIVGGHFSKLLAQEGIGQLNFLNVSSDGCNLTESKKRAGHEVPCRRKDGSEFLASMSVSQIMVSGHIVLTAIVQDITALKTTADELRASEFLLSQIIDTVPALLAYIDKDERFRFHNKAYEEVFELRFDHIRGRRLEDVLGRKAYSIVQEKIKEALQGYVVRYERVQLMARGDLRTYVMEYLPHYGDDASKAEVVGFFSFGTDITEFKRIDQMKTEFISTVSHELRTPLTSIRGSLGLISGGVAGDLPEAMKNLVQIAKNNCERLIRLINEMLDSEKIESGKMQFKLEVLDLRKLAEQSLADNQGFAVQHKVNLRLCAEDEQFLCRVDPDRFIQVLTNLISNAVKFSPAGEAVELNLLRTGDSLRLEVADHGPGVPEEFRGRIFQKFSQADSSDSRQKGGTGLGLSISRSIIEKMGGKIGFSTVVDAGSVFFIELPPWQDPERSPNIAPLQGSATKPRILICEDDPDVATLIGMMLAKAGFDSDSSHSADHAMEHLTANRYDAMTVDLKLPGESGLSLIGRVRRDEKLGALPIVVVSASAKEGELELSHEPLNISDWLEKPIEEETLTLSVRRAAARVKSGKPRILHVEDDPDIQHVVSQIVKDVAIFQLATSLEQARTRLHQEQFDLVLLDLTLGSESGWDLMADIDSLDPRPPVIVFSASDVNPAGPRQADVILVKSQTSNADLLSAIQRVTGRT